MIESHETGPAIGHDPLPPSLQDAHQLATVLDAAPQLMWTVSHDGRFLYCNSNLRWLLGDVIGHAVEHILSERLLHAEDSERWLETWRHAVSSGHPYEIQYRARTDTDRAVHWFLERGMPVKNSNIPYRWLVIATQIDEPKRHEQELLSLLQAKQRFFATLLHELKNPLAPIANAIEILAQHADDPPLVSTAGEIIRRQMRQLTRLVDDLLDMSRLARSSIGLQRRRIDLLTVIDAAIETAQPIIEARGHELITRMPSRPLLVDGDSIRMRQVIANLLINAATYTNPGGRISIEATRSADHAVLHVHDNGIGISPELLPNVFDLFVRAAPECEAAVGGMGVGLALARELVELHGGSLSAHSEGAGKGSDFTVRLPASR